MTIVSLNRLNIIFTETKNKNLANEIKNVNLSFKNNRVVIYYRKYTVKILSQSVMTRK